MNEVSDIGKRLGFSGGFLVGSIAATIISNVIWVIVYNLTH